MAESSPGTESALRQLVAEVMDVEAVTLGSPDQRETLRLAGRLREPAHEAFARLRPRFEQLGHTPFMRREEGQDVILAVRQVFKPEQGSARWNAALFLATVLTVFYTGLSNETGALLPGLDDILAGLPNALLYTASILGILGAHEMGHYLMARKHGVRVSLPYFVPMPTILGTLGAFILMKEPSPNRRVQFDIGVAGPLAGLVVAIPVLVAGLLVSEVHTRAELLAMMPPGAEATVQEGNSLLYLGLKYAIFGKILPTPAGEDVLIHAVAFAGWAGLLVTAFNLIPVGQLDGGHVLYGLLGDRARYALWPVILALVALSVVPLPGFGYQGWLLWVVLIFLLARRHAPVLDEITGLDAPRRWLAIGMLVIFVLIFVPVPIRLVPIS